MTGYGWRKEAKPPKVTAAEVHRELADDAPAHPEPTAPAAEHVADRAEVTAADLEAEWQERHRYADG